MQLKTQTVFSLLALVSALLFSTSSKASFIYDVVVDYQVGYKYEFSMSFEEITSTPLKAADLVGGDFGDRKFTKTTDGASVEYTLNNATRLVDSEYEKLFEAFEFTPASGEASFKLIFMEFEQFWSVPPDLNRILAVNESNLTSCQFGPGDPVCSQVEIPRIATSVVLRASAEPVPEPGTLALLGLGLAGLGFTRRRRKTTQV